MHLLQLFPLVFSFKLLCMVFKNFIFSHIFKIQVYFNTLFIKVINKKLNKLMPKAHTTTFLYSLYWLCDAGQSEQNETIEK